VEVPYTQKAVEKIYQWAMDDIDMAAPSLWEYEIVSVLRKYASAEIMDKDYVFKALDQIFSLNVSSIKSTLEGHRNALRWAERLSDYVAYDAQYLALAEQLEAEYWTADRRLVQAAQNAGVDWTYWLGEG
jgi:predicted nucleic acid-binding protein